MVQTRHMMKRAAIINTPSSTKNDDIVRDPEMHLTKRGDERKSTMKCHIGVDIGGELIYIIAGIAKIARKTPILLFWSW